MTRLILNFTLVVASIVLLPLLAAAQVESNHPPKCDCGSFTITSPLDSVKAGEVVEFEITADDPKALQRTFLWTVSAGAIIEGQGTTKIRVQTSADTPPTTSAQRTPVPAGSDSYVFSGPRRRFPALTAAAKYADPQTCPCQNPASATVVVGTRTEVRNRFADVTDLTLSQTSLVLPCEPGRKPGEGTVVSQTMTIDVTTSAFDPENDVLTHEYTVSGGRIIGRGAKVKWDLTGVQPGTYTITAGADDGCGVCGKTKSRTVTVAECTPACGLIECPSIDFSGPPNLKAGAVEVFTAHVSGGAQPSVSYVWTVVNGEIIGGQGTPSIKVRVAKAPDPLTGNTSVFVTLKIGGLDPAAACPDSMEKEFP